MFPKIGLLLLQTRVFTKTVALGRAEGGREDGAERKRTEELRGGRRYTKNR